MTGTNFHGPKPVPAIEVLLYQVWIPHVLAQEWGVHTFSFKCLCHVLGVFQKTMLEIPVGKMYCQVPGFNPADVNSCITNYYQSGPRTLEKSCLNEVLVVRSFYSDPALCLTLLHSELPKLYGVLAVLSAIGLIRMATVLRDQSELESLFHFS